LIEEHIRAEMACDLERTMATLVAEPEYEFCGVLLSGTETIRRFYAAVFDDLIPLITGIEPRAQMLASNLLIDEAWMSLSLRDGSNVRWSFCSLVQYRDGRIKGERVYYADPEGAAYFRRWMATRGLGETPSHDR
jgi:hypothetical protein